MTDHRVTPSRSTDKAISAVPIPRGALLARDVLLPGGRTVADTDFADAFRVPLSDGMPRDPQAWVQAAFRSPPPWIAALFVLRNLLVRPLGIEQGDDSAFDTLAATEEEVLLGTDASHLSFRASVLVEAQAVTLSTLVWTHNRRGRLYMGVVRHVHPLVVRSMLRRAARTLGCAG
ncbi:DUF2867 domain-containing protein [soil metagenome]